MYRKRGFYEKYIKRLLDIVCSLLAIIVFGWLYIIIAVLVRIKMGSPVVFKQPRPGIIDPKTGKPLIAEDALMPYEFLDEIIWRIENKHESYNDMLNSKFLYENNKNISQKQKVEWLDKFYRRMSASFYKWSILPPFVIVEAKEHNYKQPIVSSNISYKETDVKYIKDIIKNI